MARRHFNENGFPKLELLIKDILDFFDNLKISPNGSRTNVTYLGTSPYIDKMINLNGPITLKRKRRQDRFRIEEIYVVGGQAEYLPERYNTGKHDVFRTNVKEITNDNNIAGDFLYFLTSHLNDGIYSWEQADTKEFFIDLHEEYNYLGYLNLVHPPYLQIYPKMRKVLGS